MLEVYSRRRWRRRNFRQRHSYQGSKMAIDIIAMSLFSTMQTIIVKVQSNDKPLWATVSTPSASDITTAVETVEEKPTQDPNPPDNESETVASEKSPEVASPPSSDSLWPPILSMSFRFLSFRSAHFSQKFSTSKKFYRWSKYGRFWFGFSHRSVKNWNTPFSVSKWFLICEI